MSKLIKGCEIIDSNWTLIEQGSELPLQAIAAGDLVILPAHLWLTNQDILRDKANVGLWLDSHEEPATAFASATVNSSNQDEGEPASVPDSALLDCNTLPLIAINFPVFSDGRGYSYARQLRECYGYTGELRAIGDVLQDQLFFYQRCGFKSFAIRSDRNVDEALNGLNDFSITYQSAIDVKRPESRRS